MDAGNGARLHAAGGAAVTAARTKSVWAMTGL
jgi:hypothetical protein